MFQSKLTLNNDPNTPSPLFELQELHEQQAKKLKDFTKIKKNRTKKIDVLDELPDELKRKDAVSALKSDLETSYGRGYDIHLEDLFKKRVKSKFDCFYTRINLLLPLSKLGK